MKCNCGRELELPATLVCVDNDRVPIVQFVCKCGVSVMIKIQFLSPFIAIKGDNYPPIPGQYQVAIDDTINFTCPLCRGSFRIGAPIHYVENGDVKPSVICPYNCGFHTYVTLA